jgi:hypothetical protein
MNQYIVAVDWLYCGLFFSFAVLHAHYHSQLSLLSVIFLITYTSQNFLVNIIDYILYRKTSGEYYNDVKFHEMFSYKLLQGALCLLIALVYSQTLKPSFSVFIDHPKTLKQLFFMTIPMCVLMVVAFLYEMTLYDHHTRSLIFKTQLTKMGVTGVSVYFIFIVYS